MGSGQSITAEPPEAGVPPARAAGESRWRSWSVGLAFLLPATIFLGIWVVYPTGYTIVRSFFGRDDFGTFVWFDNYKTLFTSDTTLTAIRNNAIWVGVVPALVTALGLIFAVLTERVRWAVAFKTAVFMPMAISLFATGVIWRIMDQQEPDRGAVNAVIGAFHDWWSPPGALSEAFPSTPALSGSPQQGLVLKRPVRPGQVARLGLTGMAPGDVPARARQAAVPQPEPDGIVGVVWRDFKPGGGTPGKVEPQELGLPGVKVELRNVDGKTVGTATAADDGSFAFRNLDAGSYRVAVGTATFAKPFGGVAWLGSKLITPSIIVAYIWVWAGFALVVIAAGLAAIPRDVLEAARTDGATEWQVFRRVTAPLLAPVLSVVFITMIINVLKVFDIVISVAPGSVQDDATVLALTLWRTAFSSVNDFGLGSAIAVFLFLLVVPVLLLNIRRFRREG